MSLMRQVLSLVLAAVLLAVSGGVLVSTLSMRSLLQTQLQLKNNDNANALALAMSQQGGDAALMALLVQAQFDGGGYQSLRWRDAAGQVAFERESPARPQQAPAWFARLVPMAVAPGLAKVSDGWRAAGEIEVLSQTGYAQDALWRGLCELALWLGLVGLAAGLLAAAVLRQLRKPLAAAVAQADALMQGRFETRPESRVPELRRLGRAMNAMVARVQQMFEGQSAQLRQLHQQLLCDPLTGLSHRRQFMAELQSARERDDGPERATLVLLRLQDPGALNQRLGHELVDRALREVADALQVYAERARGCLAGRLNGADFALWLPAAGVAGETTDALARHLRPALAALDAGLQVAIAAVELPRGRSLGELLSLADAALARAEQGQGAVVVDLVQGDEERALAGGERAWRQQIVDALESGHSRLAEFPLIDRDGRLLHLECPLQMRLLPEGPMEPAARWLPLALRHRLSAEADLNAIALALAACAADGRPRCVNIATASLAETSFAVRARELVLAHPAAARGLGLEAAEPAAHQHFDALQGLGRLLRPLGVQLGLEHAGPDLAQVERLYEAGLDYVKLDGAVVRGVAGDAQRAAFVRGLVAMLRSLALKVHAEGIDAEEDARALWECGVDGVTGPWATRRHGG
ncbi:EAL domain-containing protein [Pelomonas sp. CA6]|uniref:bifunctional diguanylate cyclase/phosphodiesterase n=1 Tax=Pelomonas sp. CA6 TaxID=2907999 RepID=UPI001F4BDFE7|nr:LapD/MoxY N-terminal periplasmic domain-containing protein [Pelomonas sp. CA6]MCH7343872.1 EAL domain-containing protein [Pelomonas sp. CA6]